MPRHVLRRKIGDQLVAVPLHRRAVRLQAAVRDRVDAVVALDDVGRLPSAAARFPWRRTRRHLRPRWAPFGLQPCRRRRWCGRRLRRCQVVVLRRTTVSISYSTLIAATPSRRGAFAFGRDDGQQIALKFDLVAALACSGSAWTTPGTFSRRGHVDRLDLAVGVRAAQPLGDEHVLQVDVVGVLRRAGRLWPGRRAA